MPLSLKMGPLYNTGIQILKLGVRLGALRSSKMRTMLDGQRRAFADISDSKQKHGLSGYDYWFHVASLGEFEQARPIIERLRSLNPSTSILLTFFSPSGYTVRYNYPNVTTVAYLPFDTVANARRLLDLARPRVVIFTKYENWGNYLTLCAKREIPTYQISAIFRPGQIFFKPWGGFMRKILRAYNHIFVQNEESAKLLSSIGITGTTVVGDTRLDRVAEIAATAKHIPSFDKWLQDSKFTLIAGSSWAADEACYFPWLNANTDVHAIIAPHEFDSARLADMRTRLTGKTLLYSEIESGASLTDDVQNVIIDSFGLLASIYRYASVAIVGGGLGAGIHNINEPAAHGVAVLIGPNHKKFQEAGDMLKSGAAVEYHSAATVAEVLNDFRNNPERLHAARAAARAYIDANKGASDAILDKIPIL